MNTPNTAATNGAALVSLEQRTAVEKQRNRYRSTLPFSCVLAPDGQDGASLLELVKLSTEGDFEVKSLTVKLNGSTTEGGAFLDPADFGATGVKLALSEDGWGRKLFRAPVALETIATPGYADILYQPFEFEQILLAGSGLQFDMRNASAVWQHVEISLHGWQYRGSYKAAVQSGAA